MFPSFLPLLTKRDYCTIKLKRLSISRDLEYIPRNMHTVFALLCFVVVIHWLIFPYPSGLLHWHCGNLTIAPVPAKQPWWIWINTSCEFIMNDCVTTTKQSTTKPCAYFLGYTVACTRWPQFSCVLHVYSWVHMVLFGVCYFPRSVIHNFYNTQKALQAEKLICGQKLLHDIKHKKYYRKNKKM